MPVSVVEPNKHWRPCHKRVPAVVIECLDAAILAAFLRQRPLFAQAQPRPKGGTASPPKTRLNRKSRLKMQDTRVGQPARRLRIERAVPELHPCPSLCLSLDGH